MSCLDELTSTLFQPVVRYCQGDEMLKNFAAEPHLNKENKARFLAQKRKDLAVFGVFFLNDFQRNIIFLEDF